MALGYLLREGAARVLPQVPPRTHLLREGAARVLVCEDVVGEDAQGGASGRGQLLRCAKRDCADPGPCLHKACGAVGQ